jgi:hypothetical protein
MYSQEQLELAVKEAANFAYEQGKNETLVKLVQFLESLEMHPATSLSIKTVARLVKAFDA